MGDFHSNSVGLSPSLPIHILLLINETAHLFINQALYEMLAGVFFFFFVFFFPVLISVKTFSHSQGTSSSGLEMRTSCALCGRHAHLHPSAWRPGVPALHCQSTFTSSPCSSISVRPTEPLNASSDQWSVCLSWPQFYMFLVTVTYECTLITFCCG